MSHQCNCCGRVETQVPYQRCSQCQVVWYCSRRCQKEQWLNHKNICQAIKELSQREDPEPTETAFVSHLTSMQHAKIVNLVGRKCTVQCLLNDVEVSALWDTGAQVSIMTQATLEEKLPGTAVKDISELINVGLDLTATNGTKIPFIGWADVRVRLPSSTKGRTRSTCSISYYC